MNTLVGQGRVWRRLCEMCDGGRLPHALLLAGPDGSGKLALAQALARRLTGDDTGRSTDIHYSFPTIKTPDMGKEYKPVSDDFARQWHELLADGPYFSMEHWMRAIGATTQQAIITVGEAAQLTSKLNLRSAAGGYKISIIWQAERMRTDCVNKLLKLIEEPPARTVFVLTTSQPDLILETIRSRTQRIEVPPIDERDLAEALVREYGLSEEAALRDARLAGGNYLKAEQIVAGDGEDKEFFALFRDLMRAAYTTDLAACRPWTERIADDKFGREKQKRFLAYISRMIRESFIYNFRQPQLNRMTEEEEAFVSRFAPFVNEANIIAFYDRIGRAQRDIAQNANAKLLFFDLAMRFAGMVKAKL